MEAPILSSLGAEPWKAPWWKPAAGERTTFLYIMAIHILAVVGLILFPLPGWRLAGLAMFGGSGAPASWTANHRQHHSRVETPEDISSPWVGGFWWAHLRWLWQSGEGPLQRWCPDLAKPEYRFWTHAQIPVVALSMFAGLLFGVEAFFWFGPIRMLYAMHAQCFINSSAHMRRGRRDGEASS